MWWIQKCIDCVTIYIDKPCWWVDVIWVKARSLIWIRRCERHICNIYVFQKKTLLSTFFSSIHLNLDSCNKRHSRPVLSRDIEHYFKVDKSYFFYLDFLLARNIFLKMFNKIFFISFKNHVLNQSTRKDRYRNFLHQLWGGGSWLAFCRLTLCVVCMICLRWGYISCASCIVWIHS